jgi:hypothetical protein
MRGGRENDRMRKELYTKERRVGRERQNFENM